MNDRRRPVHVLVRELNKVIVSKGLSQLQIVDLLKDKLSTERVVSQSQVSRILSGESVRHSKNLDYLCELFGVKIYVARKEDAEGRRVLEKCLNELWDGSLQQARQLARLMRGVKPLLQQSGSRVMFTKKI